MLNARGAKLDGQKLVLDGVLPSATLFTSRPVRSVGHMVTPDMVKIWQTGSFAKDPPNATVSVFSKDGSSVTDAVLVLNAAKLEGERLTFDVTVLEGSLGKSDGPASVFIDTFWWGLGSNGFTYYGQSQTTGGITPNIGDPHGTSTFTGWSNPSPTGPYVPPGSVARRRRRRRAAAAGLDPRYQQPSTRRPAASLPSCPATEAIHVPLNLLAGWRWPRPSRPVGAGRRANSCRAGDRRDTDAPRRPRPSARRSSRRSCRR